MRRLRLTLGLALLLLSWNVNAQFYTGMSGLIHVPSADMDEEGEARIGMYFLNKSFTPDNFSYEGEKYHTRDYYLSITPFKWVEASYTFTLLKSLANGHEKPRLNEKDRYFSVKISPVQEKRGKWWPSVAIGGNDFYTEGHSQFFSNYYAALSKHLYLKEHQIGVHLAYRHFKRDFNDKWNGVVGGVTYSPSFARCLRAIAEYTRNEINLGLECLLWKHLFLQAALQDGRHFSGGVCFQTNLF